MTGYNSSTLKSGDNYSDRDIMRFEKSDIQDDNTDSGQDLDLFSNEKFILRSFITTNSFFEKDQQLEDNIQIKINGTRHRPNELENAIICEKNKLFDQQSIDLNNKINAKLRRIFKAPLYFSTQFNAISSKSDSKDTMEYYDLISYLNEESNKKPSLLKLISTIFLQLILIVIYYYTVVSDLYLCFCFYKNSETTNLVLTSLWFFLPQLILAIGDFKAMYSRKKTKVRFFYKIGLLLIISLFKLNVFYG